MSDAEPIVLDPDDPAFAPVPAPHAAAAVSDLLSRILARSTAVLATAEPAQAYLRRVGVTDPAVWSAFRLGTGDSSLADGLDVTAWDTLAGLGLVHAAQRTLTLAKPGGLNLPTVDPRDPERVVGVIRLTPAQNLHRFITPPAGIACAPSIADAAQVVLVDTPLVGLRLAQAGVAGIAIVEDPAVLVPLHGWLAERSLVIVAMRNERIAAIRAGLGSLGDRAAAVTALPDLTRLSAAARALLGLGAERLRAVSAPRPPVSLQLLDRLHRHALAAVQRGEGAEPLRALGISEAGFMTAFQVGYLSPAFRQALTPDDRRALEGILLGGTIILPAHDDQGVVVDLLAVQPLVGGHVTESLFDQPRGLIGAPVVTAFDTLIVTDRPRRAVRLAAGGMRNVVLLRNPADAQANAARLVAAGVRRAEVRCWRAGDEIAAALTAAGIEAIVARAGTGPGPQAGGGDEPEDSEPTALVALDVAPIPFPMPLSSAVPARAEVPAAPAGVVASTAPAASAQPTPARTVPPAADVLQVEDHDPQSETAVFRAGDLAYAVQVPWDDQTRIQVRVSRGDRSHRGEVDVALDVQRRRFAAVAGNALAIPPARIVQHLDALHAALPRLVAQSGRAGTGRAPAVQVGNVDRDHAMAQLRSPNLFDNMVSGLADLGWHGDEDRKRLLLLVALSRKLDDPAWAVLTATASPGPPIALQAIAAATPPEDCIQVTRLTDNALLHADPDALRHRLLVIDDLERVSAGVATTLRVLRARGGLSATQVERDPLHGAVRTRFIQADGPVAVLGAATAGTVHPRLAACLVEVPVDESPVQISAALAAERHRRADPAYASRASAVIAATALRLHTMQRLLEPRPVLLPDGDAVSLRPGSPRARQDQQTVLALASASALLHQHQRLSASGCIIATAADVALARRLAGLWAQETEGGLSRPAAQLLAAVQAANRPSFTMNDLAVLLPGHDRHVYRAALDELIRTEYLTAPTGGRGRLRVYHLVEKAEATPSADPFTYDSQSRQVGELAKPKTNFSPTVTHGEKVG